MPRVVPAETRPPRCPECGRGDLFETRVARAGREAWRAAYCAGEYDRERQRYFRRGCGYSGPGAPERVAEGASSETQERADAALGPQAVGGAPVQAVE